MRQFVTRVVQGVYHALVHPKQLVTVSHSTYGQGYREKLRQVWALSVVYIANLALYAGPLTLAGFGRSVVPSSPPWMPTTVLLFPGPSVWNFGYGFVQNSLFILAATVLTLVTYHVGMIATFQSRGFLKSAYAVVYSTSVYLAGIFTLVWYLSTSTGIEQTRQFVLNIQREFVYTLIDALNADVALPGGRPETISPGLLSTEGSVVMTILLVLVIYYLYSLYLGSRVNHDAGRIVSLVVVAAVSISPVIYVAGSIVVATVGGL